MVSVASLHDDDRVNALLGWLALGLIIVTAVGSVRYDDLLWGLFAFVVVAVTALPAVWARDSRMMVPWVLPVVAAVAIVVRAFGITGETAGHVAITALALIVVVELEAYTSVDMSRRFAIVFAVLTSMALIGLWTIAQYFSDLWLGSNFIRSQVDIQQDFVYVTVIAFLMGGFFEWYFDKLEHVGSYSQPTLQE